MTVDCRTEFRISPCRDVTSLYTSSEVHHASNRMVYLLPLKILEFVLINIHSLSTTLSGGAWIQGRRRHPSYDISIIIFYTLKILNTGSRYRILDQCLGSSIENHSWWKH